METFVNCGISCKEFNSSVSSNSHTSSPLLTLAARGGDANELTASISCTLYISVKLVVVLARMCELYAEEMMIVHFAPRVTLTLSKCF